MVQSNISIITYNIGFHLTNEKVRARTFCDHVKDSQPDVVCLQELTKNMFSLIKKGLADSYDTTMTNILYKYGTAILWKKSLSIEYLRHLPFESYQGRELIWIKINLPSSQSLLIATIHLESEFPYTFNKLSQYIQMFQHFETEEFLEDSAIICGDTNITEEDEHLFKFPDNWVDIWETLGSSDDNCYTYDSRSNDLTDGDFLTRLDRIFMRSTGIRPLSLEILDIRYAEFPISDHYGLFCTLKIDQ